MDSGWEANTGSSACHDPEMSGRISGWELFFFPKSDPNTFKNP
jgi:hypothetical protein